MTAGSIERFETIRGAIGTAAVGEMMVKASARIADFAEVAVYRLGPDMLAWTSLDAANAEEVAAKIANLFAEPVITRSGPIDVQWTFGLASATTDCGSSTIEQALAAVNAARADGRSLSWFRDAPSSAVRELSMMGDLRRGIENAQLFVVYQPKLSLKTAHIGDAEALVRWQHPSEGLIAPDRFLPLAEETGDPREELNLGATANAERIGNRGQHQPGLGNRGERHETHIMRNRMVDLSGEFEVRQKPLGRHRP